MMFADYIVICSESREQVEENLGRWRFALERRGMKVSHILCHSSGGSCSREELMNIRATTPVDLFRSFLASTVDLLVIKEARNKVKPRRRGKRLGVLVRLRRRGLRTALPGIFLSNVRSLCNKMDELTLQMNKNKDFPTSCVLCFTEMWLCDLIPDSVLQLGGFNLYRADRHTELSGKTKGGGICFYINNSWCNDVKVLSQLCSPDLEAFIINCKPFYFPREFSSFILVGVYILPQGNVREAQRALADEIQSVERTNPDALVIVLGDFNKGNLSHELPKYKQFIKCPTREGNVLDHCYTTISGAYRAVPRAALGQSDHIMVHLISAYRQKLKLCKPVVRTLKKWTSEAVGELQRCLDCTDWDVFRSTTNSLDEYTDTVTSYIYFCEDSIIPKFTRVSYNNDKPWFTAKLRQLRSEKEATFRSGDKGKYKEAKYRFTEELDFTDFLTDRRQFVRLGTHVSDLQHISTGSPQGCVLSPLLFSFYTNGCTSGRQSVKLLKFADETTLIGLISDGDESAYRGEIDCLVSWCSMNNLELNSLKTVEMIVDFRKDPAPLPPVILCDSPVTSAESFRFLGTTITKELKWEKNIRSLTKKAQQRMYFLRQLKKFLLPVKMLVNFYTAIIESILTSSITVWFAAATARDKAKLQRVIHSAEKVIGCSLPSLQELYVSRSRRCAAKIAADPSHPGNELFWSLPCGKRLRSIRTRTSRHKNSFFPTAVSLLNSAPLTPR
ncbi:hypothetical protein QTP86_024117 [Hemibagrus guttatus]|nr:hypothetical protein QTP86_024117 [Hemibagrus guttatus]